MNDYIILDNKKYATAAEAWEPNEERPMVVRRLMSGGTNVTFGPATFTGWRGVVLVDVTPREGFGSIDDLRATYRKRGMVEFWDHYGVEHDTVIDRSVGEKSISPMWTAEDNTFRVNLALIKL